MSIREFPRNGSRNGKVENSGETHLPCVVLVDTSGSMSGAVSELNEGLVLLGEALKEEPQALGRVELCIITFDDEPCIMVPFGPAYDYQAPSVSCGGRTAMHEAVGLALKQLEIRKQQYINCGTSYNRPWLFLLTDGIPTDPDNGEFQALLNAQKDKRCIFFPMGIGNEVDMDMLKSLIYDKEKGFVLKASKENFKNCFVWLSNSLSVTSSHNPGETASIPNPGNYGVMLEPIDIDL